MNNRKQQIMLAINGCFKMMFLGGALWSGRWPISERASFITLKVPVTLANKSVATYKIEPRSTTQLVLVHLNLVRRGSSSQPIIFKLALYRQLENYNFMLLTLSMSSNIHLPCDYIWSAVSLWGLLSFLFDEYLWSSFELKNRISMSKMSKLKLIEALNEKKLSLLKKKRHQIYRWWYRCGIGVVSLFKYRSSKCCHACCLSRRLVHKI